MSDEEKKKNDKKVDESWKDRVWSEKDTPADASVSKEHEHVHGEDCSHGHGPEELSFGMFINSLAFQVLMALGEIEDPVHKTKTKDLAHAKQIIDLLSLLKVKTKGNLTDEETKFLDLMLADLQFRFVQHSESK